MDQSCGCSIEALCHNARPIYKSGSGFWRRKISKLVPPVHDGPVLRLRPDDAGHLVRRRRGTPLSAVAAPGARWHHSATWTGSELVFGGERQPFEFLAGGGILR